MRMFDFREIREILLKNPFVFWFLSFGTLVYYLISIVSPFDSMIVGAMGTIADRGLLIEDFLSLFKSFLISLQIIFGLKFFSLSTILGLVAGWIGLSVLLALFFSLYSTLLKKAVLHENATLAILGQGIRTSFSKLLSIFILLLPATLLFLFFLGVSSIPAVILSETSIMQNSALALPVVLFDLLTVSLVFFSLLFYGLYIFMWFPSIVFDGGRILFALRRGKVYVDRVFGMLLGEFALLDLLFLLLQCATFIVKYWMSGTVRMEGISFGGLLFFIVNWLLKTLFMAVVLIYFFQRYHSIRAYFQQAKMKGPAQN